MSDAGRGRRPARPSLQGFVLNPNQGLPEDQALALLQGNLTQDGLPVDLGRSGAGFQAKQRVVRHDLQFCVQCRNAGILQAQGRRRAAADLQNSVANAKGASLPILFKD